MFASEEDFLRHFQAEAAELRAEDPEPLAAQPTLTTAAEFAPAVPAAPLRTEEDFLRLFQAEMQGVIDPPPVSPQVSPFALVEEPISTPLRAEVPMISSNVLAPQLGIAVSPAPTLEPVTEPEPKAEPSNTWDLEQVLAAEMTMPLEEVMSRNAAWLLGLEPLPVIEFDDLAMPVSSMPAAIPDRIEIPVINPVDAFGGEMPGAPRSSPQGAMAQLLEREPAPALEPEMLSERPEEPMPVLKPVKRGAVAMAPEPAAPEVVVPAWLQAQMQRDLPNSFPSDVIPKQEPSAPVIVPRRVVPKAPMTVQVEGEAKNWLSWWK